MTTSKANSIHVKLGRVQTELKAPKSEAGRFGKHRSAEGILTAAKPILDKHNLSLVLSDELLNIGERNYVKASATIYDEEGNNITSTAYAWEGDISRGLDAPQITGAATSYARKYAMGGLFALDDTKDPDSHTTPANEPAPAKPATTVASSSAAISTAQLGAMFASMRGKGFTDKEQVSRILHAFCGVDSLTKIKKVDASKLIDKLKDTSKEELIDLDPDPTPTEPEVSQEPEEEPTE